MLFFLLLEGLSSIIVASIEIYETIDNLPLERKHARYDPELGWVNLLNAHIPDLYGDGRAFTTNSRGFRGATEYAKDAPKGRTRILCIGDSFTVGYGVDDEDAWVRLLELGDPRLETVNAGLSGYGPGQALLYYRRVSREFDYDVHLFSVITHDFVRLTGDRFLGRPKPLLQLQGGRLEAANTPVVKLSLIELWWQLNGPGTILKPFRLLDLAARARSAIWPRPAKAPPRYETPDLGSNEEVKRIFAAIMREIGQDARTRGAAAAVVYLPMHDEFAPNANLEPWTDWIRAEARQAGVAFWDVGEDLRRLTRAQANALYIGLDGRALIHLGDYGHFNERGNEFVAAALATRLESLLAGTKDPDSASGRQY